jgi:hypothetical protein
MGKCTGIFGTTNEDRILSQLKPIISAERETDVAAIGEMTR